jgi:hypothetical protein
VFAASGDVVLFEVTVVRWTLLCGYALIMRRGTRRLRLDGLRRVGGHVDEHDRGVLSIRSRALGNPGAGFVLDLLATVGAWDCSARRIESKIALRGRPLPSWTPSGPARRSNPRPLPIQ